MMAQKERNQNLWGGTNNLNLIINYSTLISINISFK